MNNNGESDFYLRPQERNANLHTERGTAALEASIEQDGIIGAITVAADGEAIAGSRRLESTAEMGLDDTIYVRTDGRKRLVLIREDIPNAQDPRARRLAIADNRVAQLDLAWDPSVLLEAKEDGLIDAFFSTTEMDMFLASSTQPIVPPTPGDGGDDFDPTPSLDTPSRAKRGDIWRIGDHLLMCGDATSLPDRDRLMHDRRAHLLLTDPPYNIGKDYGPDVNDAMEPAEYEMFTRGWYDIWSAKAELAIVTPGEGNLALWYALYEEFITSLAPWIKTNALSGGKTAHFNCWEPVLFLGEGWKRTRPNNVFSYNVFEQRFKTGESLSPMHPCPKPMGLWIDLIEHYTDQGDIVVDPMGGSGTTIVACHRSVRRAICMEKSPAYCDVTLSRAAAEGIGPIERVGGVMSATPDIDEIGRPVANDIPV